MKPAPFEYHAPESIADVTTLLGEHGDDAKVLAGGQSLVPLLAMRLTRFPHLVDLNRVEELRGIERENGTLTIKAMTRQAVAEHDDTRGRGGSPPGEGAALHRPLPDPQPGHRRRLDRPRRPRVGAARGCRRPRRRARGRAREYDPPDPRGGVLRRHVDHHPRTRRGAHRRSRAGVGRSVRLRRRRDRPPQRRLRPRRRRLPRSSSTTPARFAGRRSVSSGWAPRPSGRARPRPGSSGPRRAPTISKPPVARQPASVIRATTCTRPPNTEHTSARTW